MGDMAALAMGAITEDAAECIASIETHMAFAAAEHADLIDCDKLEFDAYRDDIIEKLLKVDVSKLGGALTLLKENWLGGLEVVDAKQDILDFPEGSPSVKRFCYKDGTAWGLLSWVRQKNKVQFAMVKATVEFKLHSIALDLVNEDLQRIQNDLMIKVCKKYAKRSRPPAKPVVKLAVRSPSCGKPAPCDGPAPHSACGELGGRDELKKEVDRHRQAAEDCKAEQRELKGDVSRHAVREVDGANQREPEGDVGRQAAEEDSGAEQNELKGDVGRHAVRDADGANQREPEGDVDRQAAEDDSGAEQRELKGDVSRHAVREDDGAKQREPEGDVDRQAAEDDSGAEQKEPEGDVDRQAAEDDSGAEQMEPEGDVSRHAVREDDGAKQKEPEGDVDRQAAEEDSGAEQKEPEGDVSRHAVREDDGANQKEPEGDVDRQAAEEDSGAEQKEPEGDVDRQAAEDSEAEQNEQNELKGDVSRHAVREDNGANQREPEGDVNRQRQPASCLGGLRKVFGAGTLPPLPAKLRHDH